jgi:hypothetical protein
VRSVLFSVEFHIAHSLPGTALLEVTESCNECARRTDQQKGGNMTGAKGLVAAMSLVVVLMMSPTESSADDVTLSAGARVGIMAMTSTDITHYHVGKSSSGSFMRTYRVPWSASEVVDDPLAMELKSAGLEPVFLEPTDAFRRQSRSWIISSPLSAKLPRAAMAEIESIISAERLQALVIVAPGTNRNPEAVQGNRLRRLPAYIQGWGFSTSDEPDGITRPVVFNLTQMLLIGQDGNSWDLSFREWGGGFVYEWANFDPGSDLKALSQSEIDELRPVISDVLQRQITRLMPHIQVAG